MTRDEAIEIERRKLNKYHHVLDGVEFMAASNIDALIELGLLKVDEPKSNRKKFEEALRRRGFLAGERSACLAVYDDVFKND